MAATKTLAAVKAGRTLFANMVKDVADGLGKTELVVKRSSNEKLGKTVFAKKFRGYPIYTLTLEERATCPNECEHWADCYGNNMHRATRYGVDAAMLAMLEVELGELQRKFPGGFLVRLHILGDFMSVEYVAKWARWLGVFPALRVYGYTHHLRGSEVGGAVFSLAGERWTIRQSGDVTDAFPALSADQPEALAMVERKAAFICPVQTGRNEDCGDCTLCWASPKPVVFLTH